MLLKKATIEVEHSLLKARSKLNMEKGDIIDPGAAFAAVTPRHFVELFHDYLKTSLREGEYPDWSLSDIGAFLTCETRMRFFNASEKELSDYGVPVDIIEPYKRVRKALTRADQPPSKRKVVEGGSQLPACSFDPIIKEAISACNKHWTSLFFVDSVSWCDLDDDKIPNCSPLWKQYGMKMTPTKDKKLKPVFHVVALIGARYVTYVAPDLLNLKLGKMLETVINHLSPTAQASLRASLAFFIDRGYLELCQAQGVNMTNLVQVMEAMGVKYLGTIKNSKSFPFEIVDLNESRATTINGRPIIQAYGTRTSFTARLGGTTASVMRHGGGRIRAARAATNLVECRQDTWAYETEGLLTRFPHSVRPSPLSENPTTDDQIKHAWNLFLSSIIALTMRQRTPDWFLARYFRFTSTTFHVAVNVKASVYINTNLLRQLHSRITGILCINPRKTITVQNASELDDEDLPTQRIHQVRKEGEGERGTVVGDEKCTAEYWLRKGSNVEKLQKLCDEHGVEYTKAPATRRNVMAAGIAEKYQSLWHEKMAELLHSDIDDGDMESNKLATVAFLQRMVPYWFMRPFSSKSGGAIEQGIHNEDQIIRVLKKKVKDFSGGLYDIHGRIREFGLLARRGHPYCTSSPDGVFALRKRNSIGGYDFVSLCVLEMKTRGTENTTDALLHSVLNGGSWGECVSGSEKFRSAVPDNAYRTQLCQHATALGLEYVMMVYSLPGAQVKKIVLVQVSPDHQKEFLQFQGFLSAKYMSFAYVKNADKDIPSLGKDYSKAYGYAQEHYTLEFYLQMWLAHSKDVMENGTPTHCRRLIDIVFSYWNKCMGNVDIVRKVLKKRKAVRGPNSGPGSLMWFELIGYLFYDGFRLYQHGQLESKLRKFKSFKQFQKARRAITFTSYLFELGNGDGFSEESMSSFFPGLRELINHDNPNPAVRLSFIAKPRPSRAEVVKSNQYRKIEEFLKPGTELYALRFDTTRVHEFSLLPKNTQPGRCVVCCEFCLKGRCGVASFFQTVASESPTNDANSKRRGPSRMGRKTKRYCPTCKVILCKHCHSLFHSNALKLPSCSPFVSLIPRETRAVVTPTAGIALNVSRPRTALPTANVNVASTRGAEEADVTSPPRMQRQKKMREARQNSSSALSVSSDVDLNSPPRRQISSMTLRSSK